MRPSRTPSRHIDGRIACLGRFVVACALAFGVTACTEARLPAPPRTEIDSIAVLGIPNARFWIDRSNDALIAEAEQAEARAIAADPSSAGKAVNFLALSGGGDNGAFGAGLLAGWTDSGRRPEFKRSRPRTWCRSCG